MFRQNSLMYFQGNKVEKLVNYASLDCSLRHKFINKSNILRLYMIYEVQIRSNRYMCSNALKVLKEFVGRQTNELCLSDFLSSIVFELYDHQLGERDGRISLRMENNSKYNYTKSRNVTLVNSSSITSLNSETSVTSVNSK